MPEPCRRRNMVVFSVDAVYVLEHQFLCNSMRFGPCMQSVSHGNALWDSVSSRSISLEEVGLANKPSFPFPAFPHVGQWGSALRLGQKKKQLPFRQFSSSTRMYPPPLLLLQGTPWPMLVTCQWPQRPYWYSFKQKWRCVICTIKLTMQRTCKTNTPAFFCKNKEKKEQKRQNLWLSALKIQADVASQP